MYAPGKLDESDVTAAVDAAFASLARDKATWPATTDCDRLDGAFAALNARGDLGYQDQFYLGAPRTFELATSFKW